MKVNTKVRYGLKALAYIAENSTDKKLVRIKEISEDQDISVQYLEQILFKLKNENIIEGKRGPTGGYKLAIKPEEIDLYISQISINNDINQEEKQMLTQKLEIKYIIVVKQVVEILVFGANLTML
mgnify:CR=1 FL=1